MRACYLDDAEAIETVYAGLFTDRDLQELVDVTLSLGLEKGATRYLADLSRLEATDSVATIYSLVELYDAIPIDRRWRQAILLPVAATARADLDFYETAARNRGFEVRLFDGRDEAIAWLAET